jgi:hypothetical protein
MSRRSSPSSRCGAAPGGKAAADLAWGPVPLAVTATGQMAVADAALRQRS